MAPLALGACLSLTTGCISVATPAVGVLFTDVAWDGDAEGSVGTKEGRACANTILGLIATGDASIAAAARAGGITNVTRVDRHTTNLLGLMGEYCTIVGGS
jgi:hypothetical protein